MVVMEKEQIPHPAPLKSRKPPEPEPRQPVMISVEDVDFCYGANQVLYDVNLEIPPRAVTAFFGHPAAGEDDAVALFHRGVQNDLIDGAANLGWQHSIGGTRHSRTRRSMSSVPPWGGDGVPEIESVPEIDL